MLRELKKKKTKDGEKRFANHMPNEGLISRIHKKSRLNEKIIFLEKQLYQKKYIGIRLKIEKKNLKG